MSYKGLYGLGKCDILNREAFEVCSFKEHPSTVYPSRKSAPVRLTQIIDTQQVFKI